MTVLPSTVIRTRLDPDTSDDDLVRATRDGDNRAYGMLWERHSPAALRAARAITSSIDPDDLVSEAFAKTFSAIRNGGGPTEAFRPYLFAAVRSAAATWGGKQKDLTLEYLDELPVDGSDDSLDILSDKALLTAAFKDLPERWRTLLWYLEVEGMKPREIAPLMGMTPNAVSVLASRAREGFKVAWLNAHIDEPGRDAECRWACERIVAQGRRRQVSRADRSRFEMHLENCRRCTMASTEVAQASSKLRALLLPAIIGGPAAAAYSAATPAPVMATVSVGMLPRGAAPWLLVGGAVAVAAVVVAAIAVAAQLSPKAEPGAESSPPGGLVVESPAPVAAPAPTDPPVPPVTPESPETVLDPRPDAEISPDRIASPPAPQEVAASTAAPEPRSQPQRLPPAAPVEEPTVEEPPLEEPVVLPVTVEWSVSTPMIVPTALVGTGAAGAEVEILDEAGLVIASTVVDSAGEFSVVPDVEALHQGMSISVRHTALTGEQTVSAPIGPFSFETPSLAEVSDTFIPRIDADGDGARDDISLLLQGISGSTVSVSIDGEAATSVVLTEASTVVSVLDVRPGLGQITVRYVDPVTGALGLAQVEDVLVSP
ncbi:sigma-70 family RNA polymerase sigma factor [Microbacterium sp. WCS2018Hpa-23]|uniref:sigma-70 family RNA polymerase sigma factor n=1 Tax=Microbacterium sp. WCS2018Hpa-23 TaxID=3073634 RepID=UPI0028832F4F|nr:sigma-70 family RNA polymerase sigma factor [Microbacterium sp. WCS2018Hpa-23]